MAKSDYICCDRCDCKIVYDHDDRIAEGLAALGLDKAPALCETCRTAPSPAPAAPSAAQPDALADEREFNGQLFAMLKKVFDAPTMAVGYAILADFAAQFYPGQPVALQPAQDSLTERLRQMDAHLAEGIIVCPRCSEEITTSDMDVRSDIKEALSAARAAQPVGEVVEALTKALTFYANREHMVGDWDGWEDASGEPPNWLNAPDGHGAMIEDGGVARAALRSGEGR
ncbi:hypothetical protein E6C67_14435 [Azospirillum sp. TSA2s]|uniref:hypothetical protein n=1 Tax=Azospirillum sp. TSA2s TaxID=709810 RepID=UPI0010AB1561|nr:hypothetical protein [Azospirillum sp. TSA2s]QCG95024.1 hypothetical protein E6C67_14435 [Azospirillum sp. TSA2s]